MATSTHEDAHAASSLSTPPPEPSSTSTTNVSSNFDIISTYHTILRSSPHLTPPLAAISSLLHLLSHTPPSTTSETLSLLSHHSSLLIASVRNPIGLRAGTELFQRYTVSTLQQAAPPTPNKPDSATQDEDEEEEDGFRAVRERLLSSGRLFVERAAQARALIAETARRYVKPGATVLTAGRSRAVAAALDAAAEAGTAFRVVYVRSSSPPPSPSAPHDGRDRDEETMTMARRLRGKPGVEVALVRPESVAYCLGQVTAVMVGAEGVLENGGVVSAMGTLQLAVLARSARKPFYVLAESHKFVRLYPLGQYDLPVRQTVLEFEGGADHDGEAGAAEGGGGEQEEEEEEEEAAVDYTPPDLVTALVTEVGVLTPSAVSEELIKIWY